MILSAFKPPLVPDMSPTPSGAVTRSRTTLILPKDRGIAKLLPKQWTFAGILSCQTLRL